LPTAIVRTYCDVLRPPSIFTSTTILLVVALNTAIPRKQPSPISKHVTPHHLLLSMLSLMLRKCSPPSHSVPLLARPHLIRMSESSWISSFCLPRLRPLLRFRGVHPRVRQTLRLHLSLPPNHYQLSLLQLRLSLPRSLCVLSLVYYGRWTHPSFVHDQNRSTAVVTSERQQYTRPPLWLILTQAIQQSLATQVYQHIAPLLTRYLLLSRPLPSTLKPPSPLSSTPSSPTDLILWQPPLFSSHSNPCPSYHSRLELSRFILPFLSRAPPHQG